MKKGFWAVALCCAAIEISRGALDTAKIDQITGLKCKLNEKEDAYKVTFRATT